MFCLSEEEMLARTVPAMGTAACSGTKGVAAAAANQAKPVIVISGPSGCGKSTLLTKLFNLHPDRSENFVLIVLQ